MKVYQVLTALLLTSSILSACSNPPSEDSPINKTSGFAKVTTPYEPETAAHNGDVVNVHETLLNMEIWGEFLNNVKKKTEDQVRVTTYTIEGSPIFFELIYDRDDIHYTLDNSMDGFGTDMGRPSTICQGIDIKPDDESNFYYVLTGCEQIDIGNTFWLPANVTLKN